MYRPRWKTGSAFGRMPKVLERSNRVMIKFDYPITIKAFIEIGFPLAFKEKKGRERERC